MISHSSQRGARAQSGFTMVEMLIASVAFTFVLGSIMMGFVTFNRTFAMARDYAAARLTLSDYMNLDLRRSTQFEPTLIPDQVHGTWKTTDWTLPMAMVVPDYYQANKTTVNAPTRQTLTAAEWDEKKAANIKRGKMPPPNWVVTYGTSPTTRIVTYEQVGTLVRRTEGYGTITRNATTNAVSWTWSGTAPKPVEMASGVIQVRGVYSVTADLTPEDYSDPAPASVVNHFRANYSIRYQPSRFSKVGSQPATTLHNDLLIRTQLYGL